MDDAAQSNRPTHRVCYIKNPDNKNAKWLDLGVAWPTKNGGLMVTIDRLPYDGLPHDEDELKLVLQPFKTAE